ncbi:hypothetical protein ACJ2A9_19515 [Anaerobacillus sp. MEB173]|uniref:hypothetical protein n=1 Tax=Anaerobacillus sp. MEB173 TaxID=3383345 RepID=UPI003F901FE9
MEQNKKKNKMVNFRLRKDEDPLIMNWLDAQSNLASAFRYMIRKDSLTHGIRDLAENTVKNEVQALNQTFDELFELLPKLKIEQKLTLYFKLQSEVNSNFQQGDSQIPFGNQTSAIQSFESRKKGLDSQLGNKSKVDAPIYDEKTSSDVGNKADHQIGLPNQNFKKENQLENNAWETGVNSAQKQEGSERGVKEEEIDSRSSQLNGQEDTHLPFTNEDKEVKRKKKKKQDTEDLLEFFSQND